MVMKQNRAGGSVSGCVTYTGMNGEGSQKEKKRVKWEQNGGLAGVA